MNHGVRGAALIALASAVSLPGCSLFEVDEIHFTPVFGEGRAFLGPLGPSTAALERFDDGSGDRLGSSVTAGQGRFLIGAVVEAREVCAVVRVHGGSYTDPIGGAEVPLDADGLRAVFCDGEERELVAVTPLTEIATARAHALLSLGLSAADAVAAANAGVAQLFGLPAVQGILPSDPSVEYEVRESSAEQRAYGLMVAALAQLAEDRGTTALELTRTLAADLADGAADGALVEELRGAAASFAGSAKNLSGQEAPPLPQVAPAIGPSAAGELHLQSAGLPAWISGRAGSASLLAAGGNGELGWGVVAGALPQWLSLDSGGTFSGTAPILPAGTTRSVSAPFVVEVRDQSSPQQRRNVTLTVTVTAPPPMLQVADAGTWRVGEAREVQVATATGDFGPYYFARETGAGFPPPGVALRPDGVLAGTPGDDGEYGFGICAVDLAGNMSCSELRVTVRVLPREGGGGSSSSSSGGGGSCAGGWLGSVASCVPLGPGGSCVCTGETSDCITADKMASIGLSLPAACAPEGTVGCLDDMGRLHRPCCPGLTCRASDMCGQIGGGGTGQCLP